MPRGYPDIEVSANLPVVIHVHSRSIGGRKQIVGISMGGPGSLRELYNQIGVPTNHGMEVIDYSTDALEILLTTASEGKWLGYVRMSDSVQHYSPDGKGGLEADEWNLTFVRLPF